MKNALVFAAVAALSVAGCKKKNDAATAGSGSAAATTPTAKTGEPATPTTPTAPPAAKGKTCEERGGTKVGDSCELKTPPPIEAVFTGKFDTDMMNPDSPGAIFKVTNKLAVPVKLHNAELYVYDKAGKQLEMDIGGSKSKYAQDSQMSLLDLGPNETKDLRHSVGKKNLPADMDTLQLEVTSWSEDGVEFSRHTETGWEDNRPKDGWK